jgi:hypothetical protein
VFTRRHYPTPRHGCPAARQLFANQAIARDGFVADPCSAFLGRDVLDPRGMLRNVIEAVRQENALARWRALLERNPGTPLCGRPDRARYEAAAAIRADVPELLDAPAQNVHS